MEYCKNLIKFCFICGHFTPSKRSKGQLSQKLILTYEKYFDQKFISGVPWVPQTICKRCYNYLLEWSHHKRKSLPFGVPMIWTNPINHDPSNCYACVNTKRGLQKKNMAKFQYKSVRSAQVPLPHTDNIPTRCPSPDVFSTDEYMSSLPEMGVQYLYNPEPSDISSPIMITQERLDFIVAKLQLTQRKSEELGSFLRAHNLLAPTTKVSAYRKRQADLQKMFSVNDSKTYSYCSDVTALMASMNIEHKPEEWRLFIDSSTTSLKAVLLHKTNLKPSIPVAYSTDTKETYNILKTILESIDYAKHEWKICCDLKVVAMLCGMQSGYTKNMCFMCDWDTRFKGNQYNTKNWNMRNESNIGFRNVVREPLVSKEKILLPPLHVKLGIVKSFIKTIAKGEKVMTCLKEIFPRLSPAKLMNGKYICIH